MLLLNELPSPDKFEPSQDRGSSLNVNTVINSLVKADYYYPEHFSPMGILYNSNGSADYKVNNRHYTLSDDYFLILNHNSKLEIDIQYKSSLQTLFVFFDCTIIKKVQSVFVRTQEDLLDDPYSEQKELPEFTERLHHKMEGNIINALLKLTQQDFIKYEKREFFYDMFGRLLHVNQQDQKQIKNIKAVKKSTRNEIYNRLYKAKFYMDEAYSSSSLTLEDIAQYAALNTFHFLRLFKQLFAVTPHQYLTAIRLQRAKELLLKTNLPVIEVCWNTGFESPGSFSLLFKRNYAYPPQVFRMKFKG
jgi:AraC family transcriptional regulator